MERIKNFFKTPKKAVLSLLGIGAVIIILGTGTVFATTSIAESSSIGKENAQNFAFVDAGVDPAQVQIIENKFGFERGQFVYEVEFIVEGTKYEYYIKASDGSIVKKEIDATNSIASAKNKEEQNRQNITEENSNQPTANENQEVQNPTIDTNTQKSNQNNQTVNTNSQVGDQTANTNNQVSNQTTSQNNQGTISLEAAKSKALSNAGVSSSNATFTKTKLEREDGRLVYKIEFYTTTHEYEYEINAKTGVVYKQEAEKLKKQTTNQTSNKSTYIGIDVAKSIALKHAGASNSETTFKKAQLDREDGMEVYEIEFYKGVIEYEYEINAITGEIIKFDID